MHNRTVSPENTNGRVRLGNLSKYMITNPGDSWSHLVFMHKIFERMLPHESFGLQADMLYQ